ncbi:hypothetical protein GCM10010329_19830 [Streptomyces spiroverticillatus]|uniref:Integral membrane protein n=1 Tax=Streptomyces finlayi TaxID=67296 RepID=A0A918WU74_9ACTN|nr:hypothetical protein [Streptomyces finlayi]GGZ98392.1 hypothetical protein GCM10010329_19830 [Streptomyces spiroverticillatus]GHC83297.1 hypothetical protein GCM10010334_12270 [Streptomyces finlayi]
MLLRRLLPAALLALVALLVPLGAVAMWADVEVEDTGRYVSTMAPLAEDPDVQKAVSTRLTSEIMKQVDLGPLQNGAERLIGEAARSFTGTPPFQKAWNTVNRVTHDAFRDALDAPQGSGDRVVLDLAPVTEELKQQLKDDGVPFAGRIPVVHTDLTLVETDQLDTWRSAYAFLESAAWWAPVAAVLLVAGAVVVSVRGRRLPAVAMAGGAFVLGALILALALAVVHNLALSHLPEDVSRTAGEAVYSTLTGSLRAAAWWLGLGGLAVALAAGGGWWLRGRRVNSGTPSDQPAREDAAAHAR